MLPVVDKPLIQYAVEEAIASGVTRLVFVTGAAKRAIEDHFDTDEALERLLESQGKSALAHQLRSMLPSHVSCIYIRQPAPLGLGHAVLCARPVVGDEPFFVHLADDLIEADVPCLKQMAGTYSALGGSVLGVEIVPRHDTDRYGIVEIEASEGPVNRIRSIVEKPKPEIAPSTLAVVGRYVLSPGIFAELDRVGAGAGGEIQLTDGIARLLAHEPVYAHRFTGRRFDCGNKLGYLQATVELSLAHPTLGRDFRQYLLEVAGRLADSGPARARKA
jgi:UTP--glucose-1-phosphate uridylyltransferase